MRTLWSSWRMALWFGAVATPLMAQPQPALEAQTESTGPAPVEVASLSLLPEAPAPADAVIASMAVSAVSPCGVWAAAPPADASGLDPCAKPFHANSRFLNTTDPSPLTSQQKGMLAIHSFRSPGNLLTVVGTAGYTIATNAHTAYGPGWRGFGSNVGHAFLQEATGEFFGTYAIPSLTHQDPRYHRIPNASIPRRVLHAIVRTVIAQSDTGRLMPNYSNLLTNPICAELSNLYVPGVETSAASTVERILTGYATAPEDTLITEFLPDVAKHIHIRVILVQRILNPVTADTHSQP